MSSRDWIPDNHEPVDGKAAAPYVLVPSLRLAGNIQFNRMNVAGWVDKDGSSYTCATCKKQVRLSLSELRIFPLVNRDSDQFQFVYLVPLHRTGGAFSTEICKESETKVLRSHEYPTSVRFVDSDQVPTGDQEGLEPSPESAASEAAHEEVDKEEVKKQVAAMSPQTAEERYDYLLSRPISELTDAEYTERLALVERLTEKQRKPKQE